MKDRAADWTATCDLGAALTIVGAFVVSSMLPFVMAGTGPRLSPPAQPPRTTVPASMTAAIGLRRSSMWGPFACFLGTLARLFGVQPKRLAFDPLSCDELGRFEGHTEPRGV